MLSFPSLGRSHTGSWTLDAAQLESVRNTASTWSLCLLLEATVSSSLGPSPALPTVVTLCSPLLARSHLGHHPGASGRSQSLHIPATCSPSLHLLPPGLFHLVLCPPQPHCSHPSLTGPQLQSHPLRCPFLLLVPLWSTLPGPPATLGPHLLFVFSFLH